MPTKLIVVLITASSSEEAQKIAQALVAEKLAACVNVVPNLTSFFRWKGEDCKESEVLLICKSREPLIPQIVNRVKELHSYTVPEIIALPIIGGSDEYLWWVDENLC
jgi:periplasmic divalent cation tolerance protein